MKPYVASLAAAVCLTSPVAFAQEQSISLPEACRTAAMSTGAGDQMQQMKQGMSKNMEAVQEAMSQVTETQRSMHRSMLEMNGPMMEGSMNIDADVSWICAMIPHHQGAIAMAQAGLAKADNEESRRLAEKTIDENEKGLRELIAWAEEHAAAESDDEAGSEGKSSN
ncbi:DUF305 domain-containing protein [Tianweitania sediminis]|uniref:DUF305 domain-containing protein n=1 Tax=Tianweitania sediminis TaxID=1502156 RepID=A0A8J7RQH0_9HYPH|nr:DUF305 domain-containing protein [Tianweitania sediminis]MBP0441291.1 DUF305 domain-containing protein [Tianweitania sediminis]